jgi:hypothetical protein
VREDLSTAHIERPAARPDADLACEFRIAKDLADDGFRARLAGGMVGRPRDITGGIAVAFRPESWDDVSRYIAVESECCPFLDLAARRFVDRVELRVTGRPAALEFIRNIFAPSVDCR